MAIEMTFEKQIQAPPDAVYAALANPDGWHEWMPGLIRIERLTEGEFGVGTQWREVRKMFGKEAAEVFEVSAVEPGRSIDIYVDGSKGSSRKGEYRFHHRIEPSPGSVGRSAQIG